jgi:hypothetical protein
MAGLYDGNAPPARQPLQYSEVAMNRSRNLGNSSVTRPRHINVPAVTLDYHWAYFDCSKRY